MDKKPIETVKVESLTFEEHLRRVFPTNASKLARKKVKKIRPLLRERMDLFSFITCEELRINVAWLSMKINRQLQNGIDIVNIGKKIVFALKYNNSTYVYVCSRKQIQAFNYITVFIHPLTSLIYECSFTFGIRIYSLEGKYISCFSVPWIGWITFGRRYFGIHDDEDIENSSLIEVFDYAGRAIEYPNASKHKNLIL